MHKLLAIALAGLALVATACGSDPSDAARAEAALLRLSDLPEGFRATEGQPTVESPCVGFKRGKDGVSGGASSRIFRLGDSMQAQSSVHVYADEAAARRSFAAMVGSGTATCFGGILAKSIGAQLGVAPAGVRVEPLKLAAMPAERAGSRVRVPIRIEGVGIELLTDLVFIRSGRSVAVHTYTSEAQEPFGTELRERLSRTTIDRLGRLSAT
jgi:hypothetical protein